MGTGASIILYADDILLIAPSVTGLEQVLRVCKIELLWLDMLINVNESSCLRIGPRSHVLCSTINTASGHSLSWSSVFRYLGVLITRSRKFKCVLDHAKCSFHRAANNIMVK